MKTHKPHFIGRAILMLVLVVAPAGLSMANKGEDGLDDSKAATRFRELDLNSDRRLSVDEYVAGKSGEEREKAIRRFRELDADKDDRLTFPEFKAGFEG